MIRQFFLFSILLFFSFLPAGAVEEQFFELVPDGEKETIQKREEIFDDVIKLDETIDGDSISGDDFVDNTKNDFKLYGEYIFAKKKAVVFKKGPVNKLQAELRYQGTNAFDKIGDNMSSAYPFILDLAVDSEFLENKYRFFGEYSFTSDVEGLDSEFFGKFSNLFLERSFSDNHKIRIGTSRLPIGLEGSMSVFSLPFINRAQISRNFGNAISTGISFIGNKDAIEYNIGGFTSTRYTQGFKDGAEFAGRIGYKPFYDREGSLFRELKIYTGADIGHRSKNYEVYSAALSYDYKKFLMNLEYAYADASNAKIYNSSERQGFFTTLGWNFTPKLQLILRYDCFDPDTSASGDLNHEYTAGINYFVFKQRLKFALNYVFSDNDADNGTKNAIYFLTQFFI